MNTTNSPVTPVSQDDNGMDNFINPTIDVTGFQWEHQGHVMMLEDMSRSDLQQALCTTMTVMEALECQQSNQQQLMEAWRHGRPVPEHLRDAS